MLDIKNKCSFGKFALVWFKIGCVSFGGPVGQIALLHREVVEKRAWISEDAFLHALNFCMVLPGPEAQQLATYLGWLMHGKRGGLVAGLLFILPSLVLMLAISALYLTFGSIPWVNSIFSGLQCVVVAIMIESFTKLCKRTLKKTLFWFLAIGFGLLTFWGHCSFVMILAIAAFGGLILPRFFVRSFALKKASVDENSTLGNEPNLVSKHRLAWNSLLTFGVGAILWGGVLSALMMMFGKSAWLVTIAVFFTKVALFTFGGAYAVLPYVKSVFVDQYHWIESHQMLDALALGESTPGPLIMILCFMAFMAAPRQMACSPLLAGSLAAVVTTWFVFLPSFVMIFAGAPWIERSRTSLGLQGILQVIRIAVISQIFSLIVFFSKALLWKHQQIQWFDIVLCLVAWLALTVFKRSMGVVLAGGMILGLLMHIF